MMQEKKEKLQKRFKVPRWLRVVMAKVVAICGILTIAFLVAFWGHSWLPGIVSFILVVPLFPAVQAILLGKRPPKLVRFLRIYFLEFALLFLSLALLLVSAPFIFVIVASRMVIGLLIAAVIMWLILGLQQIVDIGVHMVKSDVIILFWVTLALAAAVTVYYFLYKFDKKYNYKDKYFNLWGRLFEKTKALFSSEITGEEDDGNEY